MSDLFENAAGGTHEPLAARMRPRNLDEYIGQSHIVGKGRLLRRAIAADQLTSVIFYGPPGTGKTTLAKVIANHTSSNFITLNAVLTGVADIRKSIADAESQKNLYGRKTILFVDEVHRWNKSQQDALLPWVENGTFILIGATTENPFFEVNKALVSRSRVFQLKHLTSQDLIKAAKNALEDRERGYGKWKVVFEDGALEHLVETANGDCRSLLNALELAVETTPDEWNPENGIPNFGTEIYISKETCEESIQKKVVLYDRDGDYHYDIISAFIKSLRGRDPDAACYWLAKMMKAGEDPHFVFRRMMISACEDTGLADPHAISVVESCAQAFDRVGLPEGHFFLAHAALYLATAPKSNSSMAFFDAMAAVEKEDTEVPNHLRDGNRDAEGFGHGAGYLYPHAYRDHWVAQQYLPDELVGKVFYSPSTQGYEAKIREEVLGRREVQIAAIMENVYEQQYMDDLMVNPAEDWWAETGHFNGFKKTGENLTFSPKDRTRDTLLNKGESQWRSRIDFNKSENLAFIRDTLLENAEILRYHRCLILNADDSLLLFELIRRTPEGLVAGSCRTRRGMESLLQYASTLGDMDKPLLAVNPGEKSFNCPMLPVILNNFSETEFDRVFIRDCFTNIDSVAEGIAVVSDILNKADSDMRFLISQKIPSGGQHLGQLIHLDENLADKVEKAETEFFTDDENPFFCWNEKTIKNEFENAGCTCRITLKKLSENRRITSDDMDKWFNTETSAYGKYMKTRLGIEDFEMFRNTFIKECSDKLIRWTFRIAFISVS